METESSLLLFTGATPPTETLCLAQTACVEILKHVQWLETYNTPESGVRSLVPYGCTLYVNTLGRSE